MTSRSVVEALAAATASLVGQADPQTVLNQLVADCRDLLDADAVGVMAIGQSGALELLAATSHRAIELELFQAQEDRGPCHDAISHGTSIHADTDADIRDLWGSVGQVIVANGFHTVRSFPIRWNGEALGCLNVFGSPLSGRDDVLVGQAFADATALLLTRDLDLSSDEVTTRVKAVVDGRVIIEQAKGVLAHRYRLTMSDAYDRLSDMADNNGYTLTQTATQVVQRAVQR